MSEIFSMAKVEMPNHIDEVQKLLNAHPDIQFSEWKRHIDNN